jgi:hypothetical protein
MVLTLTRCVSQGFPEGEYLLIENRQPLSYDQRIPLGGLAIYHVDMKTSGWWTQGWPNQANWPQNGNHYRVAMLQADGLYQLESTSYVDNSLRSNLFKPLAFAVSACIKTPPLFLLQATR